MGIANDEEDIDEHIDDIEANDDVNSANADDNITATPISNNDSDDDAFDDSVEGLQSDDASAPLGSDDYDIEGVGADSEGVGVPNTQIENAPLEGVREAPPITNNNVRAQKIYTNRRLMRMSRFHIKGTKDGDTYTFAIVTAASAFGLDNYTTTVTSFLHAQTAYVNLLVTYCKVNTAIQHAAEHLDLTQLGMKAGMNMWGQDIVESIVKEMK